MLPLINKRWARLLRGPSTAWRDVTVGYDEELLQVAFGFTHAEAGKTLNTDAVVDWITSHSG